MKIIIILSFLALSSCKTLDERYAFYKKDAKLLEYCKMIEKDTVKHTGKKMSSYAFSQCLNSAYQDQERNRLLQSISLSLLGIYLVILLEVITVELRK